METLGGIPKEDEMLPHDPRRGRSFRPQLNFLN